MSNQALLSIANRSGWSLSTIAERQAPALKASGDLVEKLGLCILFSTTSVAAGIRLDRLVHIDVEQRKNVRPQIFRQSDLGSELDAIATNGLEIFTRANEYLHHVRLATQSIGRDRGPLENLHNDITDPEAQVNNKRLLKRVKREIENSFKNFDKIVTDFDVWTEQIEALKKAVRDKQLTSKEDQDEIASQLLMRAQEAEEKKQSHDAVKADLEYLENNFNQKLISNYSPGTSFGLFDWALSAIYRKEEQPKKEKEREYERRRQEAERCRQELFHAQASLAEWQEKGPKEERLARLLETTLTALGLISAQIGSVFADFNKLKAQTIRLVEEHSARLEEYDYDEQGITDKKSAEQFRKDMIELRGTVLFVEHLSWMYAGVIEQVMVKGIDYVIRHPQLASADADETLRFIKESPSSLLCIDDGNESVTSFASTQVEQSFREGCERFQKWQAASEAQFSITQDRSQPQSSSSQRTESESQAPSPPGLKAGRMSHGFGRSAGQQSQTALEPQHSRMPYDDGYGTATGNTQYKVNNGGMYNEDTYEARVRASVIENLGHEPTRGNLPFYESTYEARAKMPAMESTRHAYDARGKSPVVEIHEPAPKQKGKLRSLFSKRK